jgi:hypothetical protein
MTGRRVLAVLVAVLVVALTAGCGVRPSGVITGGPAPTRAVWGTVLYFLAGSTLTPVIRPTDRPVPTADTPSLPATDTPTLPPAEALTLLQGGPDSDEQAQDLTSEVPAGLDPVTITTDTSGGVDVGVSVDVTTLSPAAVDQVVCTVRDALPDATSVTLTSATASRGPRTCPLAG